MRKLYYYLRANWYWGKSIDIIVKDCVATVCLSVRDDSPEYGYVSSLIVDELHRGKGIGRDLMAEVERQARIMGLKHLYLGARKTSFVAGWYMRLGFRVCEECMEEGTDLLFSMMKDL